MELVRDDAAPGRFKRVFQATPVGLQVCAAWMQRGAPAQPMRGDIHAWLVLSRPEEAPDILEKLDAWEQDCMERAEGSKEPPGRAVSWTDRMFAQDRAAIREQYLCQIRSIKRTRREIRDYLAEQQ